MTDPSFVETVVRALYVDDFASGKDSVKDSFELYQKLKLRFGRRGLPNLFISDNGKPFKDRKVKKFVLNLNIDWKFNVPTASW